MSQSLNIYLIVSIALFSLGMIGILLRRNVLFILMSIELMLNAANIAFVTFARKFAADSAAAMTGHVFVLATITVAAVEAAVGIAIVVVLFRSRQNINVDEITDLKG